VLSIDIDNFKAINDSAGHAAGDAVLCEVAAVLRNRFRATDVLARLGGDEFGVLLPAAGRFGLIHAIERWVVQQAIELIARSAPDQRLAVNLSGESVVGDAHLPAMIERALADASVDPSRLIFEITETAAIANMTEATRFAKELTSLGCSLAPDDFGTGFGSFYYLRHLPVRYVKMNGEFIHNLPRSQVDEHMVRAIVGVAQGLGIKTVAESVADDETIRLLQQHGSTTPKGSTPGGRRRSPPD
jgi:EAL domain-containing protein (putative c-di-GMP-specific phosphodiesterase class I)